MNKALSGAAAAALLLACGLASAQQGIAVSAQPFVSPLPIAPAVPVEPEPEAAEPAVISVVVAPPAAPELRFEVTQTDQSVREALVRWAKEAGWVHESVHWDLDRDFPIAAVAGPEVFGPEFKAAVRVLLSSTELTDRPVQPCFYSNNVVRVIPQAELCNRTAD